MMMNNNNSGPKQQVRSSSSFSLPRLGPEKENASHPPNQEGPEGTRTKQQPNTTRSPAGLQRLHSTSPGSAITTTTHLLSRRKRGILRYGETMESLFLLHDNHKNPHDEEEQRRRCQRLIDHARSDDNDDASLWRKVLENTSHEVSAASNVIRLYRRATSRLSQNVSDDALAVWLLFVRVLIQFDSNPDDIRTTLKHLQNIYRHKASVYLALATFERTKAKNTSLAIQTLELGLQRKAEPRQELIQHLNQWKAESSSANDNNNNRDLLENSNNMSLDSTTTLEEIPAITHGDLGASNSNDTKESVKFDLKPLGTKEFDAGKQQRTPQSKNTSISRERTQPSAEAITKTPSYSIASQRPPKSSARRPPLLQKRLRPQGLSGKAARIDPEHSMELLLDSESDEEKTEAPKPQKKPKITKMDISYMLAWDPNKPFSKQQPDNSAQKPKTPGPPNHHHSTTTTSSTGSSSSSSISHNLPSPDKQPAETPLGDKKQNAAPNKRHSETGILGNKSDALEEVNMDFLPLVSKRNIIHVNGVPYAKLGVIGKGGSCRVYRALSKDCNVVAIKKVALEDKDTKTIESYANEISLLKRLRGNPAIIQLYDSEVDLKRQAIFLTMELGEVDLNHVLRQQALAASDDGGSGRRQLNMNFIRLTWQQMLGAVHSIHEAKIIHGDLKPANFLFVRGALKLIDFGIAKAIQNEDTTNIYRESHIGTLNYMSPEAIITGDDKRLKVGRASDIWSLGCILYQMVYGRTPFAELHMIQKLQAIIDPRHLIKYPDTIDDDAKDAIQQCLQRKPEDRPPIVGHKGLLNEHVFLNSKAKSSCS